MDNKTRKELKKQLAGLNMAHDQLEAWLTEDENFEILIRMHDEFDEDAFPTMEREEAIKAVAVQMVLGKILEQKIERGDFD
jgi:hypothetical protein